MKKRLPAEAVAFVRDGSLEIVSEDEAKKTVEFHVPSRRRTHKGYITSWSVVWIHPDFNAEFCHYHDEKRGDLPNFYAPKDTTDVGNEFISGRNTVEDLVAWLASRSPSREASTRVGGRGRRHRTEFHSENSRYPYDSYGASAASPQ